MPFDIRCSFQGLSTRTLTKHPGNAALEAGNSCKNHCIVVQSNAPVEADVR